MNIRETFLSRRKRKLSYTEMKSCLNISRITANITRKRKSARKLNSIMHIAQLGIMCSNGYDKFFKLLYI